MVLRRICTFRKRVVLVASITLLVTKINIARVFVAPTRILHQKDVQIRPVRNAEILQTEHV